MDERPLLTPPEATRIMLRHVKQADVKDAVHNALFDPARSILISNGNENMLNYVLEILDIHVPGFVRAPQFGGEFARLNKVWTHLYNQSPLVSLPLGEHVIVDNPHSPLKPISAGEYVDYVRSANEKFFVPFTLALASSVFGDCIAPDLRNLHSATDIERVLFQPAVDFAQEFGSKPKTIREVIARLQIVFPDPDQPFQVRSSGFEELVQHGTFRQKLCNPTTFKVEDRNCPAPDITHQLYDALGQELQTSAYQKLVIERVRR